MRAARVEGAYRVDDAGLFAGPHPARGGAEEAARVLASLHAAGVGVVVDLTEEHEAEPYAALLGGIRHVRRPIPDFGTVAVEEYAATLDVVDDGLREGAVYVHCLGGRGRTGTVVGCWLVRHGLDGGNAVARIAELRGDPPDAPVASPETAAQRAVVEGWRRGR